MPGNDSLVVRVADIKLPKYKNMDVCYSKL